MAVRPPRLVTIFGVAAIVFGIVSGLALHQTSADPGPVFEQQSQRRSTPSGPRIQNVERPDESVAPRIKGQLDLLALPSPIKTRSSMPAVGIQAVQTVNFEDFSDKNWPANSPGWDSFQSRRTDNVVPTCGGVTCDTYWGAGYTPDINDPACPGYASLDPRLAGRTFAWPALGGVNSINPNCRYYPTYLDSWMVYGPVNVQDSKALSITYSLLMSITEVVHAPGELTKEGLGIYFFPDDTGTGYGYAYRQDVYTTDEIELFTTLEAFGITERPRSTYIVIRFVSDGTRDDFDADGAFLDYVRINKETDPAKTSLKGTLLPSMSIGTDVAPSGNFGGGGGIANGGFDNGLAGWNVRSQNPTLPTLTAIAGNQNIGVNGSRAAVLGDQAIKCVANGSPPRDGNSILENVFQVPSSGNLRFQYRYFTEDYTKDKQSDSFDVRIRTSGDVNDGDLVFRKELTKAEVDAFTQEQRGNFPGLDSRACDNTATRKSYVEPTAGFKTVNLSLDAYRGKSVTLSFQLWNRIDTQFNTYVILDSVEIVP